MGKLTFLAPAGAIAQRLCRRRVAASAQVQEPAPRPGEDLPRPRTARQPPPRSRRPCSQLRHAPPASAVAAGPPAAGLRAAWLPAPSALCRRPGRVSGNPAAAGREQGLQRTLALGVLRLLKNGHSDFFLIYVSFSMHNVQSDTESKGSQCKVSSTPNPFPSHLL